MRTTTPKWIIENNILVGVFLPHAFCAEHEWGIDDLKYILGIKKQINSINDCQMTNPDCKDVYFKKTNTRAILVVGIESSLMSVDKKYIPDSLTCKRDDLLGAWDGKSFGLSGRSKDDKKYITDLDEAINSNNISLWLGGNDKENPFDRPGLTICITSRISDENKRFFNEALKDFK